MSERALVPRSLLRGAVALFLVLAPAACQRTSEAPAGPPDPLPPAEADRARELGSAAAGALASGLVEQLTRSIADDGPAGAIAFCADEAPLLIREIQEAHDPRLGVKRTTLRPRNPANAPDAWEERMLRYLQETESRDPGMVPPELTARGPDGSLRYYRVLRTAPMCLTCHGGEAALDPEVREVLSARYPEDLATGYGEGDLRGVIRVQIPAR